MIEDTLRDWLREGREQGRREGFQEGLQESRQEAKVEGMRRLLLHVLGRRFGTLPLRVRRQLAAISSVERFEEILVAESLQEMGLE
ncbi:MAG TPA: hypothetical protein VFE33_29750 [Thermoanaerobaculia bacterium]|nr:hypothetical protein [Thermoanaerobaculia bacterium]